MARTLFLLVAIACVGCWDQKPTTAPSVPLPTRDEFRAKWMGKTQDEVLAAFGKPGNTIELGDGMTSWSYSKLARDPVTDKPEPFIHIRIDRTGHVAEITF